MPCGKARSYIRVCVEDCICIPSGGKSTTCLCRNETTYILHCNCLYVDECKCYKVCSCRCTQKQVKSGNNCVGCSCIPLEKSSSLCNTETCGCYASKRCSCKGASAQKPGDGKCLCFGSSPGVCVCNNEKNIKTCGGSCEGSGAREMENKECVTSRADYDERCKCKGNASSCVCVCKNKEREFVCCGDCKCDGNNKCDKDGCSCVKKVTMTATGEAKSCVRYKNASSCICVCRNEAEEVVCCVDCKCDENNKCDKEGCSCVPKETMTATGESKSCVRYKNASSCICVCKNEAEEVVCCVDCKCDGNNKCDKEGCSCVPKEVKTEAKASKSYVNSERVKSCICVCKNEAEEVVCCNDCKCNGNNKCDKDGCSCVPKETMTATGKAKSCVRYKTASSCTCVCKNEEGEVVCCNDCKCDGNNKCDKEECSCVPKEVKTEAKASKSYFNSERVTSCICVCKDEGETICCEDCKCDEDNICTKEGCTCVS